MYFKNVIAAVLEQDDYESVLEEVAEGFLLWADARGCSKEVGEMRREIAHPCALALYETRNKLLREQWKWTNTCKNNSNAKS